MVLASRPVFTEILLLPTLAYGWHLPDREVFPVTMDRDFRTGLYLIGKLKFQAT